MRRNVAILFAVLVSFHTPHAFADAAAIQAGALPQETAVLAALDDITQLESYCHSWTDSWQYPIAKEDVATRLGKDLGFLSLALKSHPQNAELALLTGLAAQCAYNVDLPNSHVTALDALSQALKLAPSDVRAPWFRATLLCQTSELKAGADEFLSIESSHACDQLPAAFWEDYSSCATISNLPEHTLRAVDHLKKLLGAAPPGIDTFAEIARSRIVPFDPKKEYDPKEVWVAAPVGDNSQFTSTTCGVRFDVHGDWAVNQLAVTNGSCVAYFSTGPYKATTRNLRPSILVLVKQPEANETLQEFSSKFLLKGTFEPFTPSRCPAETCIAMKGSQPGMYGNDGDGHGRVVVFERNQPEYPGLIFESPAEFPKQDAKPGTQVFRPNQVQLRIPGKLYYLVMLDTAASIEAPAMKDFDSFLQNLTVE